MGLNEEDDYASSDEVDSAKTKDNDDGGGSQEGAASSLSTSRERQSSSSATATPANHDSLPSKGESFFLSSRSSSIATSGVMPEILIRRRTRLASTVQKEDGTSASGSASGLSPVGAIAQASRIITDLPQEQGGVMFPLDSARGNSGLEEGGYDTSD